MIKYQVSEDISKLLIKAKPNPNFGWLLGYQDDILIQVTSLCMILNEEGGTIKVISNEIIKHEIDYLHGIYPHGIQVLGVISIYQDNINTSVLNVLSKLKMLSDTAMEHDIKEHGELHRKLKKRHAIFAIWCNNELNIFDDNVRVEYDKIKRHETEFFKNYKLLNFGFGVNLPLFEGKSEKSSIKAIFDNLELAFFDDSSLLIYNDSKNEKKMIGSKSKGILKDISDSYNLNMDIYLDNNNTSSQLIESKITFQDIKSDIKPVKCLNYRFKFSGSVYVPIDTPLTKIKNSYLFIALKYQMASFQETISKFKDSNKFSCLRFELEEIAHPLLIIYPYDVDKKPINEDTKEIENKKKIQKSLHLRFYIPSNKPTFQPSQSENQKLKIKSNRLINIHTNLKNPDIKNGGEIALIKGNYEYCHYGQDDCNDSGWGCAYRSLQTLFSWFKLQNYTDLEIPTHKCIQKTLAEIGDKDISFVGSKEWIGSIEVGYVLDELLGVSHKIIAKNKDKDVLSIANQLLYHFKTEGTPISIGGGVLAYTLLGIYVNLDTSDVRLLILDPHYSGPDDLEKIIKEGWIAWKKPNDLATAGGPLFVENTFYNFMCPLRPDII